MKNRSRYPEIILFIFLSLLLHLFFLGFGTFFQKDRPRPLEEVEVTLLKRPYQIADIAPPEKEERPKEAKFLGLYDSRVEREQVAATPPRPASQGSQPSVSRRESQERAPQREGEGIKLAAKSPEKRELPGAEGDEFLDALPEDFYPDYKVGDRTYLNVLRFPKIGYFVRLKKIFKTTFDPAPAIRPYFLTNQVTRGQVEAVLGVSVDRTGNLAELFLIRSSGLKSYDQETLRTIRDSAPFAAPPQELLNGPGLLRMVWTFTVYL